MIIIIQFSIHLNQMYIHDGTGYEHVYYFFHTFVISWCLSDLTAVTR